MNEVIREKLKLLPENPGVYIMLDEYGNVIYVGKARVLKNRVRQYFHNSQKPEKVMKMVRCFSYTQSLWNKAVLAGQWWRTPLPS